MFKIKGITLKITNQHINKFRSLSSAVKAIKAFLIFKRGEYTEVGNYRPVPLLPTVSEICEKLVLSSWWIFEVGKSVRTVQNGFRKHH